MLLLLSAAHVGEVNHSAEQACSVTDLRGLDVFRTSGAATLRCVAIVTAPGYGPNVPGTPLLWE